ncbi:hypothetical protein INT43_004717 [Umbelopsis isabellina]|uniref:F-box domain-containing protein n=1 Tax=Mortierella isabellina TaxID=91625 RepID=A0A8H7PG99_MORIS|nr:hypothetical protein INT43_004717 [Umbelopsis isabellina]
MSSINSLPHKILRNIFEFCSTEDLFNIMPVSTLWKATASQVVAHSFITKDLVMWVDQEGRIWPIVINMLLQYSLLTWYVSYVLRPPFKLREQKSDTLDIYNLMFGLKRPCLRLITVGDDNQWDYLEKAGPISLKHTGKKTMLASDHSSADKTFHQWRFTYNIEYLYRKNRKIDGERVFVPEIFECSLSFLNPRRAHRTKLTWYVKKHIKNIDPTASKTARRTKIHGEVSPAEWHNFFEQHSNEVGPQILTKFNIVQTGFCGLSQKQFVLHPSSNAWLPLCKLRRALIRALNLICNKAYPTDLQHAGYSTNAKKKNEIDSNAPTAGSSHIFTAASTCADNHTELLVKERTVT